MTSEQIAEIIAGEARRLAEDIAARQPRVQTPALTIGMDVEAMGSAVGDVLSAAVERIAASLAHAIAEERAARQAHLAALTERLEVTLAALPPPADMGGIERSLADMAIAVREMAAPIDLTPVADAVENSGSAIADAVTTSALAIIGAQADAAATMSAALDRNTEAQLRDRDLKFDSSGKIVGTKVA